MQNEPSKGSSNKKTPCKAADDVCAPSSGAGCRLPAF